MAEKTNDLVEQNAHLTGELLGKAREKGWEWIDLSNQEPRRYCDVANCLIYDCGYFLKMGSADRCGLHLGNRLGVVVPRATDAERESKAPKIRLKKKGEEGLPIDLHSVSLVPIENSLILVENMTSLQFRAYAKAKHWYWQDGTNGVKYGCVGASDPTADGVFLRRHTMGVEVGRFVLTGSGVFRCGSCLRAYLGDHQLVTIVTPNDERVRPEVAAMGVTATEQAKRLERYKAATARTLDDGGPWSLESEHTEASGAVIEVFVNPKGDRMERRTPTESVKQVHATCKKVRIKAVPYKAGLYGITKEENARRLQLRREDEADEKEEGRDERNDVCRRDTDRHDGKKVFAEFDGMCRPCALELARMDCECDQVDPAERCLACSWRSVIEPTCVTCGAWHTYNPLFKAGLCYDCHRTEERVAEAEASKAEAEAMEESPRPPGPPRRRRAGWDAINGWPQLVLVLLTVLLAGCRGESTKTADVPPGAEMRVIAKQYGNKLYAVTDPETGATVYWTGDSRGGVAVLPAAEKRR